MYGTYFGRLQSTLQVNFGLMAMPLVHRLGLSDLTVKAYPLKSAVVTIPWGSQDHYVL